MQDVGSLFMRASLALHYAAQYFSDAAAANAVRDFSEAYERNSPGSSAVIDEVLFRFAACADLELTGVGYVTASASPRQDPRFMTDWARGADNGLRSLSDADLANKCFLEVHSRLSYLSPEFAFMEEVFTRFCDKSSIVLTEEGYCRAQASGFESVA